MRNDSDDEFIRGVDEFLRSLEQGSRPFIDSEDVEEYTRAMLDLTRYDDAETIANYGLQIYPNNETYMLLLAWALIAQEKNIEKAQALLDKIEPKFKNNVEYVMQLGWIEFIDGHIDTALGLFERCLKLFQKSLEENDAFVIYDIGERLNMAELYEEALIYLRAYDAYDNEMVDCIFNIAYALSQLDRLDDSIAQYKRIFELDPFYDNAWYNLGLIYVYKNDYDNALNAFQTAISITPTHAESYFNLGNVHKLQNKRYEAIEDYTEYISLCNGEVNNDVYAILGECWQILGDFDLAKRFALLCLDKDPQNLTAKYVLGGSHINEQNFAEAIKIFKEICKEEPDDVFAVYTLAFCHLEDHKYYMAERYAKKAIGMDHDLSAAWIVYARCSSDKTVPKSKHDKVSLLIGFVEYMSDMIECYQKEYGDLPVFEFFEGVIDYFMGLAQKNPTQLKQGLKTLDKVAKKYPHIFHIGITEPTLEPIMIREDIREIMKKNNMLYE